LFDATYFGEYLAMTPEEQRVLDHLAQAWNAYLALPVVHTDDMAEFRQAIHAAQNIVLARPSVRSSRQPVRLLGPSETK
jgi:hypothetical protein